jgi:hypothetical protein
LSSTFIGEIEHTYAFYSVATDKVGLKELPPPYADAQTSLLAYMAGDANMSGSVSGLDVVFLVNYLKGRGPRPNPLLAGDANGSCSVSGLDVTYIVRYLKGMSPRPFRGNCS